MGTAHIILSLDKGPLEDASLAVFTESGDVIDGYDGVPRPYAIAASPFVPLTAMDPVPNTYEASVEVDASVSGLLTPAVVIMDEHGEVLSWTMIPDAVWYVQDGVPVTSLMRRMKRLDENTLGAGSLELRTLDGGLVYGGVIRIYGWEEYTTEQDPQPITSVYTGDDGKWTTRPLLPAGRTYAVVLAAGGQTPERVMEVSL